MSLYSPKELVSSRNLSTSSSAVYTVPGTTTSIIKEILLANITAGALTATIYFVPSGQTAATSNAMYYEVSIDGNSTQMIESTSVLSTGSSIHAKASADNSINIHVSGVEVS